MSEVMDARLRAVEFLLVHLISRTRSLGDLKADREELKKIVDEGRAWMLMPELARSQAQDVVEAAGELLDDALVHRGSPE